MLWRCFSTDRVFCFIGVRMIAFHLLNGFLHLLKLLFWGMGCVDLWLTHTMNLIINVLQIGEDFTSLPNDCFVWFLMKEFSSINLCFCIWASAYIIIFCHKFHLVLRCELYKSFSVPGLLSGYWVPQVLFFLVGMKLVCLIFFPSLLQNRNWVCESDAYQDQALCSASFMPCMVCSAS